LNGFPNIQYQQLGQKIGSSLLRLNLASQIGVAENPLLALHAARAARPFQLVENSREFVAELPIENIEPSAPALNILKKWGIHTLGEFAALGKEPLAARLGPEALELFDRASANCARPLRLVRPAQTFEEELNWSMRLKPPSRCSCCWGDSWNKSVCGLKWPARRRRN